jgi:hypothetical protein
MVLARCGAAFSGTDAVGGTRPVAMTASENKATNGNGDGRRMEILLPAQTLGLLLQRVLSRRNPAALIGLRADPRQSGGRKNLVQTFGVRASHLLCERPDQRSDSSRA